MDGHEKEKAAITPASAASHSLVESFLAIHPLRHCGSQDPGRDYQADEDQIQAAPGLSSTLAPTWRRDVWAGRTPGNPTRAAARTTAGPRRSSD